MINIQMTGLRELQQRLGESGRQVPYAASRAINSTAFAINARIKDEMQRVFQGGAAPYTLRAFEVSKSSKANLTATVMLRKNAPEGGGTPYAKALRHLFTSGTRDWKRLEGYLRARGLMPSGLMAVPGRDCPLDSRGNIRRTALREMLGGLGTGSKGMRVYRRTGGGKALKAVGYFAILPGAGSKLKPGIYKRIETRGSSGLQPMVMFVRKGNWRQAIDLGQLGQDMAGQTFVREFDKELGRALASAR
ncbi:MAG: hypothetical protein RL758_1620 [Pseudomonadota bacterium]|jgi:hypothetical protein